MVRILFARTLQEVTHVDVYLAMNVMVIDVKVSVLVTVPGTCLCSQKMSVENPKLDFLISIQK